MFFQAGDGIRDLVRSRGLGDVYKRQEDKRVTAVRLELVGVVEALEHVQHVAEPLRHCLLYTSDAADELPRVVLGGRRDIQKKNTLNNPPPHTN